MRLLLFFGLATIVLAACKGTNPVSVEASSSLTTVEAQGSLNDAFCLYSANGGVEVGDKLVFKTESSDIVAQELGGQDGTTELRLIASQDVEEGQSCAEIESIEIEREVGGVSQKISLECQVTSASKEGQKTFFQCNGMRK